MEDQIKSTLDKFIKSESKKISYAVIEGESNVVDSTADWKISQDVRKIIKFWNEIEKEEKFIEERIKNLEEELQALRGEASVTNREEEIIDLYKVLTSFYNKKIDYPTRIIVSKEHFIVLQWTTNRLIAVSVNKNGGLVAFRDEERRIIYKIDAEGSLPLGLMEASRELWERSVKEPYMEADETLGKQLEWATPRILLDDTYNLQELGLIKFGLSIEEAKVYLALLGRCSEGETVGNLNEELEIKRTTIYRILNRLIEKEWVVELIKGTRGAKYFLARPIDLIFDERIQQKEEELKILKSFRMIMGEYGWVGFDDSIKENALDFKTLGITGGEKDCGLHVFEYGRAIENEVIIRAALQLSCETLKLRTQKNEDVEDFTNPDLEEIEFEPIEIENKYQGAEMYLIFREGSETANNIGTTRILAAKLIAIPVENKINVIWGTEERYPFLMNILMNLY